MHRINYDDNELKHSLIENKMGGNSTISAKRYVNRNILYKGVKQEAFNTNVFLKSKMLDESLLPRVVFIKIRL